MIAYADADYKYCLVAHNNDIYRPNCKCVKARMDISNAVLQKFY